MLRIKASAICDGDAVRTATAPAESASVTDASSTEVSVAWPSSRLTTFKKADGSCAAGIMTGAIAGPPDIIARIPASLLAVDTTAFTPGSIAGEAPKPANTANHEPSDSKWRAKWNAAQKGTRGRFVLVRTYLLSNVF
ncbi:MAG: hypothetical protein ABL967_13910 [Bryobacteraceae bacterium]